MNSSRRSSKVETDTANIVEEENRFRETIVAPACPSDNYAAINLAANGMVIADSTVETNTMLEARDTSVS